MDTERAPPPSGETTRMRIAVVIVAYNAVHTLAHVLDRIPSKVWDRVEEVIVFDDSSNDETYLVALGYREHFKRSKLNVFRNERNLGYGGNQKRAYRYAIDQGYDLVVLLHGDGQYAPEMLPTLIGPFERDEADAVFGSRMMIPGDARKGGMPLYKFVGNRILSGFENFALGMDLTEFHSGYRVYATRALARIPFEENTDDFHFDTQIIIQLQAAGLRIKELPIPTYYGDEICYVNGLRYAKDVFRSVVDYKLHQLGVKSDASYAVDPPYKMKRSSLSSHARLLQMVGTGQKRILDIGCGTGELGSKLRERGHHVVGVSDTPPELELDEFYKCDLDEGLPVDGQREFDVIILADVLEHLVDPAAVLVEARARLADGGLVIVSLPNVVHWSVRAQVALGRFEYANQGILDRTHLRFYTLRSAEDLLCGAGFEVMDRVTTPVPWENVIPPAVGTAVTAAVEHTDHFMSKVAPNLFAYQHIFRLQKSPMKGEDVASSAAESGRRTADG